MAAPHVAGRRALLLQRHPGWTADQVKSALVATSRPARSPASRVAPTRVGAGFVDLVAADNPLVLAHPPSSVTFGLLEPGALGDPTDRAHRRGRRRRRLVGRRRGSPAARPAPSCRRPPSVTVPGTLDAHRTRPARADGEVAGNVVLTRNGVVRRVPFWLRVSNPALARRADDPADPAGWLPRQHARAGRRSSTTYRYPQVPPGGLVTARLAGPEQVFRLRIARPVANFGVVDHVARARCRSRAAGRGRRRREPAHRATRRSRST